MKKQIEALRVSRPAIARCSSAFYLSDSITGPGIPAAGIQKRNGRTQPRILLV